MSLRLDWCSHEAAKFAVANWHYSKTLPANKFVSIGAWELEQFIGAVLFSLGSGAATDGRKLGLGRFFEMAELQRVALKHSHVAPVSRVVAIALRFLKKQSPGIRVVVSFADPGEGHHGGIYQAGNWIYVGESAPGREFLLTDGRWVHNRTIGKQWGSEAAARKLLAGPVRKRPGKHKYLMPLDDEMRARIAPLAKPYPKRVRSIDSDAPGFQSGEGGAIPTRTLHD